MRIGLLSYHRNYNYGWNLQCYALLHILKSMGHEVLYIDKRKFKKQSFQTLIKSFCKKVLYRFIVNEHPKRIQNYSFFEDYIKPRSRVISNPKEYKYLPKFDVLIVGSDQVWRPKLVTPIEDYYFNFINYPAKLISYAASFGVDFTEYSKSNIVRCSKLIKRFNAVSVREASGINLIKDVYKWDCEPKVMPDPTLLLDKSHYLDIIKQKGFDTESKEESLFCYILDRTEEKQNIINWLISKTKLPKYEISPNDCEKLPSVESWLFAFQKSKLIFTDSFHGCVFSLIFRKPFLVFGNKSRGLSRFVSLLQTFKQEDRLIMSYDDLKNISLKEIMKMNEEQISVIQTSLRDRAIDYLSTNIQ